MGRAPARVVPHRTVVPVNARIAVNGKTKSRDLKAVLLAAFRRRKETVVSFNAEELVLRVHSPISIRKPILFLICSQLF